MSKQHLYKPKFRKQTRLGLMLASGITVLSISLILLQKPVMAEAVLVFKSPTCGCCIEWVKHLKAHGFDVETQDRRDMSTIKEQFGIATHMQSCHTAQVGGYVIEGHVPADDIKRLLEEQTEVSGLAVPGMPHGSPGMDMTTRKDPYKVLSFVHSGHTKVFSHHHQ